MLQLVKIVNFKNMLYVLLALMAMSLSAKALASEFITFAVSSDDKQIFSIHATSNSGRELRVTDVATGVVINKMALPLVSHFSWFKPSLIVSLDGKKLYITDIDKRLYFVDILNKSVERIKNKPKQDVGRETASAMLLTPDGRYLYIADGIQQLHSPAVIHILDTTTNKIIKTVSGKEGWWWGVIAPDWNALRLYISRQFDYYDYEISIFDTRTHSITVNAIKINSHIAAMAMNPINNQLYLVEKDRVSVFDPINKKTIEEIFPSDYDLGAHSFTSIVFALHGNKFYMLDDNGIKDRQGVMVFDAYTKISHLIPIEHVYGSSEIRVSVDGLKIYVNENEVIHVIDTNSDSVLQSLKLND